MLCRNHEKCGKQLSYPLDDKLGYFCSQQCRDDFLGKRPGSEDEEKEVKCNGKNLTHHPP